LIICTLVIVGSVASYKATQFPFTYQRPLKVRFGQHIDLDDGHGGIPIVRVVGTGNYTRQVLEDLPSVKADLMAANLSCSVGIYGVQTCQYVGLEPHLTSTSDYSDILDIEVLNNTVPTHGPNHAEIAIRAANNRKCYLAFNTSVFRSNDPNSLERSPVRLVSVIHREAADNFASTAGSSEAASWLPPKWDKSNDQDTLRYSAGIEDLTIWRQDYNDPTYRIALEWIPQWSDDGPDSRLGVTVTCEYFEYDHEVDIDGTSFRMVPAYDELLSYSPEWVTVTSSGGIVRLSKHVEL
jgi:hypothetical protein